MRKTLSIMMVLSAVALVGCGGVKEESISVKGSPTASIQQTLERYAKGSPVSSEVTSYPNLVSEMKKVDPAKGDILEKGLAEIQKNPKEAKSKAQELLKKLGLESADKDAGKDASKDASKDAGKDAKSK